MIAVVKDGNPQFKPGDLFTGNGDDGGVLRITDNGNTVIRNWCSLPKSARGTAGLLRGALIVDNLGYFDYNLVIVTADGNVYIVQNSNSTLTCYNPRLIASVGTHLEGVTIIPNQPSLYGALAGKILAGAEDQGKLYAFLDPQKLPAGAQNVWSWNIGMNIEALDYIRPGENMFAINYGNGQLLGVDYTQFQNDINKIFALQEFVGVYEIYWDFNQNLPVSSAWPVDPASPMNPNSGSFEQMVFAPAGISEIPPVGFCYAGKAFDGSGAVVSANLQAIRLSGADTAISNYNYLNSRYNSQLVPAVSKKLLVYLMYDYRNVYSLTVVAGAGDNNPGTASIAITSTGLPSTANFLVQDDSNDQFLWSASGQGSAKLAWGASDTDGFVLGDFGMVVAKVAFDLTLTVQASTGLTAITVLESNTNGAKVFRDIPLVNGVGTVRLRRYSCTCGNNVTDGIEICDPSAGSPCCGADCLSYQPGSTLCRAAAHPICDQPEYCTGNSPSCPPNQFTANTVQCSTSGSDCLYCTGNSAACATTGTTCPQCNSPVIANCSNHGSCNVTAVGGANVATCYCQGTHTGPICDQPRCVEHADCGSCSANPYCGWCCGSSTCMPLTNAQNCSSSWMGSQCAPPSCQNGGTPMCDTCSCAAGFSGPTCNTTHDCTGRVLNPGDVPAPFNVCGCNVTNTSCIGCDNVPFGKKLDLCGVCGGNGSSCFTICGFDNCRDCTTAETCSWCPISSTCATLSQRAATLCVDPNDNAQTSLWSQDSGSCGSSHSGLSVAATAGLAAGAVVGIAIAAAIVGLLVFGTGGKLAYDYTKRHKVATDAVKSNPLYEEGAGGDKFNPLYEVNSTAQ